MSIIIGRFVYGYRLSEDVYTAEIQVVDGRFPQTVGVIENMQYRDHTFHFPIRYAEICKTKGIYRLFFDISKAKEIDYLQLVNHLHNQLIELEASNYSLFHLQSNSRKVLLFVDESAIFESLAIIYFLFFNKIETCLYVKTERKQGGTMSYVQNLLPNRISFISSCAYQEIFPILNEQVIGTKLFISGIWPMISEVKKIAYTAGFTDEEIQYKGIGPKNETVFCVKCYHLNRKKNEYEIICEHCNTMLDVSTHFSRRLDAYLGYIKIV